MNSRSKLWGMGRYSVPAIPWAVVHPLHPLFKLILCPRLRAFIAFWLLSFLVINGFSEPSKLLPGQESGDVASFLNFYSSRVEHRTDFYGPEYTSWRKRVIQYYRDTTNAIPTEQKIIIAACLGKEGDFASAAKLLEDYVKVYTNSVDGWTMLGSAYIKTDEFEKSLAPLERAVNLGGEEIVCELCGAACYAGRMDVVQRYVPRLLKLKDQQDTPERIKLDIIGMLGLYSEKTNDEAFFLKLIGDLDVSKVFSRRGVGEQLLQAAKTFRSEKAFAFQKKLEALNKNIGPKNR